MDTIDDGELGRAGRCKYGKVTRGRRKGQCRLHKKAPKASKRRSGQRHCVRTAVNRLTRREYCADYEPGPSPYPKGTRFIQPVYGARRSKRRRSR
jgi:hypothetical protein